LKVLLVRPHVILKVAKRLRDFLHLEPLALEIVAGGIDLKHEVSILDLASVKKPEKIFMHALSVYTPDVIGFTGYSNQAKAVKELALRAREWLPDALIMAGGIHATVAPKDYLSCTGLDLVIRGEGGSAMKRLFAEIERGSPIPEDEVFLHARSPASQSMAGRRPPPLPDWQAVPQPRRELVDRSDYFCIWHGGPGEKLPTLYPRTAAMRTSVGCPNRCNFCVVHYLADGKYLQRTPEETVDEIDSVAEEHIYFVDDEMFINPRRCERIAQLLLERGIEKKYVSWARADTICKYPELFRLWEKAGLSLLYVGLESLDAETLEGFNKGIEPDVNRRAVKILRELGIGLHAALMVRPEFGEEDFARLREAVDYVTPAEVTFTVFSPSPGTPLWEKYENDFICPDPYSFYDCFHTILPTTLPLKKFYARFAQLYLAGARENPWRHNSVKVPLKDFVHFIYSGIRYGIALRGIYQDYPHSS